MMPQNGTRKCAWCRWPVFLRLGYAYERVPTRHPIFGWVVVVYYYHEMCVELKEDAETFNYAGG